MCDGRRLGDARVSFWTAVPTFRPPTMLRSRIASIDIIESSSGDTTVLPSSSVVLGMQFAGSVRAGRTALTPAGVTGLAGAIFVAMTKTPDIFTNVHKGIRRALFSACTALGRAGNDAEAQTQARAVLTEALRFVAHHGDNEDVLLLPILEQRAPDLAAQMKRAHHALDKARERLGDLPFERLYLATCSFTASYLEHMSDEELVFEPRIREVLSIEDLTSFGQRSVQRTAPADQRMMLGWMLPAMVREEASAFLARLPEALADELRKLVDSN